MSHVVSATLVSYALPFTRPVVTSQVTLTERRGWLIALRDGAGRVGWGEAACWPGFGAGPAKTLRALRHYVSGGLLGRPLSTQADLERWSLPTRALPEASHAIELAALDLLAHQGRVSVAQLLSSTPRAQVPIAVLVAGPDEARAATAAGVRTLKIKVGRNAVDEDAACLAAIRDAVGSDVALRVDANGAWTAPQALHALDRLRTFGLEFVEQPTAPDDLEGLSRVCTHARMPVAVDEGLRHSDDLERAAAAGAAIAVIKPMAVGGLLAAQALAEAAIELGLRPLITTTLESAVGRLGALHLAAALPDTLPCGLASLLAEDVAATPAIANGALAVPTSPGLHLPGVMKTQGAAA